MTHRILVTGLFSALALSAALPLLAIDRIPAQIDVVGHLPSVGRLKLQQALEALPSQKEEGRKKLKQLMAALGLQSIDSIKDVWLLVDRRDTRDENRSLIVATVDLELDTVRQGLESFKLPTGNATLGGVPALVLRNGKAAACVPRKGQLLLGHPEVLEAYLALKPGESNDQLRKPAVARLFSSLVPEAYLQLLVTHHEPRPESRWKFGRDHRGPIPRKIQEHLSAGATLECGVVQLFDDKLAVELHYARDSAQHKLRGELTTTDPKLRISALIDLIIAELPGVK